MMALNKRVMNKDSINTRKTKTMVFCKNSNKPKSDIQLGRREWKLQTTAST